MVGEVAVGDQPGEVDDPFDPGLGTRDRHAFGGLAVLGDEVAVLHRVDQVDHRVHADHGGADELRILDVEEARGHLVAPGVLVGGTLAADRGVHLVTVLQEIGDEPGADVAGRTGDEHAHG